MSDGTRAEVILTKNGDLWHLQARSEAESGEQALAAVQVIYEAFTRRFETWVRIAPEVASDRDFDTKLMVHAGYVRFSFAEREGPIHAPELSPAPLPFGTLEEQPR